MNTMLPTAAAAIAALMLSACALTPEQQAARAAEQKRYEQDLQTALAAQCDADTAALMRRQFDGNTGSTQAEQQAFRLNYAEKVSDKMFQACYKLAWQNHIAQQRLQQIRYYDHEDWWYGPRPWGWRRW